MGLHPIFREAIRPFVHPSNHSAFGIKADQDEDFSDTLGDDYEPGICPACNGSGEGQYDGTRCSTCKGKGEA